MTGAGTGAGARTKNRGKKAEPEPKIYNFSSATQSLSDRIEFALILYAFYWLSSCMASTCTCYFQQHITLVKANSFHCDTVPLDIVKRKGS